MSASPRLYGELAWVWEFVSPASDYVEEAEAYVEQFRRHGVPDGGRVLHLGSGGGSLDWHLKRQYRLTGVDRSPAMLAQARQLNPEVAYLQGDLRDARLGELFDGVLVHDAIAYLTSPAELRAAYRTAAAHLRPGGVLVALPEQVRERFDPSRTEVTTRAVGDRSVTTVEVAFDPDPADTSFEETFVFLIRQAGQLAVEVDTHLIGLHPLDEFVAAVTEADFVAQVEELWLGPGDTHPVIVGVRS